VVLEEPFDLGRGDAGDGKLGDLLLAEELRSGSVHNTAARTSTLGVAGPASRASRSRASSRVPVEWAASISEASSLNCS
jgi:hypothetical protein